MKVADSSQAWEKVVEIDGGAWHGWASHGTVAET